MPMKTLCLLGLLLSLSLSTNAVDNSALFVPGMTLVGGADSCPLVVMGVSGGSPAQRAGITAGDILVAVDGSSSLSHAKLDATTPTPVNLTLLRGTKRYSVTVGRENSSEELERNHEKILKVSTYDMIVPLDATFDEMNNKLKLLDRDRLVDRVFPTHYPDRGSLYYAGFEVLLLKNPAQVVVLGIEYSPASRAGVHWGDTILSVNGVDPRNKSVKELGPLFSSDKPAAMTLKIEREGITKTFTFQLEKTDDVLRDNQQHFLQGTIVPLGLPEKYISCFRLPDSNPPH
jgi:C-terminal processing protease CtpA/Prc